MQCKDGTGIYSIPTCPSTCTQLRCPSPHPAVAVSPADFPSAVVTDSPRIDVAGPPTRSASPGFVDERSLEIPIAAHPRHGGRKSRKQCADPSNRHPPIAYREPATAKHHTMTAERRGQPELHVRLPSRAPAAPLSAALPELPPVSALFLIEFDVKAGYTISWKASRPGLELEGVVEYKSLPSGLHTVSEDLIYFVHESHAGLSAFVNAPCEDTELRNARMLAVGVLVPLSFGRLGRAWKHAEGLKAMASGLVANAKDTTALEEYWAKHQARDHNPRNTEDTLESPVAQPGNPGRSSRRNRSASDGAGLLPPGHRLSSFHPAWSLSKLLDTFGPLIFPIHRAALLRKRILISCHAPVQEVNNFGMLRILVTRTEPLADPKQFTTSLFFPISRSRPTRISCRAVLHIG